MALDPVCGMTVEPATAAGRSDYKGTTYYFCSKRCVSAFESDPERYLSGKKHRAAMPAEPGAKYTCPMHPEIVQVGPGSCPKCGMALVPMEGATETDHSELRDLTRRLWVSAALSVPLLFSMLFTFPKVLELALATPVVLWGGWPFLWKFWLSLHHR